MAISDINKLMAMYTQPTEFDQNAWKTAFDISNAFTNANNNRTSADENARKHRENLATEDWRTAYQKADFLDRTNQANWNIDTRNATQQGAINFTNAQNQANAAAQNNAYTQHNAIADSWRMITDAVQANGGRMPTQEELFNIARANPNINPALFANVASQYQNWAGNQARMLAPVNPQAASQYNVLGGITPNMLDNNGNVVNFNSGEILGALPKGLDPAVFATGGANTGSQELTWQQKQDYQQEQTVLNNLQRDLGKLMNLEGMITDNSDNTGKVVNQTMFNQQIANLASIYQNNPRALQAIRNYANEAARQNGWYIKSQ
ncbi:hypothetical protein [Rodentibacter pneumotropicus]|uniref:Uncharacterized protein n=2 Tax=Rodentibacter pneumotropicus TaxID=758 RepID=A0A4S2QD43_9PAST|nr:hypothetical protein [Rodentibacter pneumotropicus]THA14890.1 hypothetical protein D3M76_06570 [Rodentibacter pneumotropicus]